MLMFIVAELAILGAKHHNRKYKKHQNNPNKHAYHVYMLALYTKILGLTLDSDKLRERYLNK